MASKYKVGDIISARVSGIEKYGIFVNVDDKYNGLVHISEVSSDFVKDIGDFVSIDEIIYCQILEINESESQLKLSIKNINYKSDLGDSPIKETRKGFLPLKDALDNWIEEKIKAYKKES